ncbi:variable surface protein [Plasmodium gonderi]|uniref:Variable surface protein n=1 Tax=Plasmodium gonderi TaxID=77519 RepID=A0A1Y1JKB9_PLAGO|nr:variable surface protein [Plasmodium gonderi]GAW82740.1 variable surface protein [Plasmodium gonderi]
MDNYLKSYIEETRKKLPAYVTYKKLKDKVHVVTSSIFPELFENLKDNERAYINEIVDFCSVFSWNLKYLSKVIDNILNHDDQCSYLSYWAYERIRNIFPTKSDYNRNSHIINKLNDIVIRINNKVSTNKPCYIYFGKEFDEWDDWKKLHDYFKNSEYILSVIDKYNFDEGKKFCNYVNHIKMLYEKYEKGCCLWSNCSDYINCNEKYNPSELLKQLKCEDYIIEQPTNVAELLDSSAKSSEIPKNPELENSMRINYLKCYTSHKDEKKEEEPESTIAQCYYLIPRGKEIHKPMAVTIPGKRTNTRRNLSVLWTVPLAEETYREYRINTDEKNLVIKSKEFEEHSKIETSKVYSPNNLQNLSSDGDHMRNNIYSWGNNGSNISDNSCNNLFCNPTRVVVLVLLKLGIFFVFFIYFKFTPFGNWIRNKLLKKKKINYNYNQERKKLGESRNNSYKNNLKNKRISISYDSNER